MPHVKGFVVIDAQVHVLRRRLDLQLQAVHLAIHELALPEANANAFVAVLAGCGSGDRPSFGAWPARIPVHAELSEGLEPNERRSLRCLLVSLSLSRFWPSDPHSKHPRHPQEKKIESQKDDQAHL
jgi:hypothetical protein